jgi:hypothetical protein
MYEKVEAPQVIRLESPQKWGFFYDHKFVDLFWYI